MVIVAAAHSKHRREDRQPIRADLADLLRTWLADSRRVNGYLAGCPATRPGCYGRTWQRHGGHGWERPRATKRGRCGEDGFPVL